MTLWPAEKADQRIAASSARLVRAALRQAFDPLDVWQRYLATLPEPSDNRTLDRVRARAWAVLNVRLNPEPMQAALRRVYAEGWVTGRLAAEEAVRRAREAQKAPDSGGIDWDTWRPGNTAAAILVQPPNGLKRLLDDTGSVIRGLDRTTLDRLGSALADTLTLGVGEKAGAKIIGAVIADPARALSITITEQARALSAATMQTYRDAGLDQQEWFAGDPCPICAQNNGKTVLLGDAFPSGHTQPPAHPYCRCALLPVIPDFEAEPQAPIRTPEGQPDVQPTEGQIITLRPEAPETLNTPRPQRQLTESEIDAIKYYTDDGYVKMNRILRTGSGSTVKDEKAIKYLTNATKESFLAADTTVFRGVGIDAFPSADLTTLIGETISDRGFLSTTADTALPPKFDRYKVQMRLQAPAGTPGLDVSSVSVVPGEREIIFPPRTKIEITNAVRRELSAPGAFYWEVEARIVS